MAKKTGKTTATAPTMRPIAGSDANEPPRPVTGTPDDERVERISIPLTADGKRVNWDRMRPATKDQLRAVLAGDVNAGTPGAVAPETIDPAVVGMLYGSIGMLMVSAARARGFTAEQANVLIFTPEEKQALQEPTARVLAKYAGAMGKYQDEITLAVTLGMVMTGKISQLRKPAPVIAMAPKPVEVDWDVKDGDKGNAS